MAEKLFLYKRYDPLNMIPWPTCSYGSIPILENLSSTLSWDNQLHPEILPLFWLMLDWRICRPHTRTVHKMTTAEDKMWAIKCGRSRERVHWEVIARYPTSWSPIMLYVHPALQIHIMVFRSYVRNRCAPPLFHVKNVEQHLHHIVHILPVYFIVRITFRAWYYKIQLLKRRNNCRATTAVHPCERWFSKGTDPRNSKRCALIDHVAWDATTLMQQSAAIIPLYFIWNDMLYLRNLEQLSRGRCLLERLQLS